MHGGWFTLEAICWRYYAKLYKRVVYPPITPTPLSMEIHVPLFATLEADVSIQDFVVGTAVYVYTRPDGGYRFRGNPLRVASRDYQPGRTLFGFVHPRQPHIQQLLLGVGVVLLEVQVRGMTRTFAPARTCDVGTIAALGSELLGVVITLWIPPDLPPAIGTSDLPLARLGHTCAVVWYG
jgi:hypothetical protein